MSNSATLYFALAVPLLVAGCLLHGVRRRMILFFLVGLTVCLLSAYINSFLTLAFETSSEEALIKFTPLSEEILKALPILFAIAVFGFKDDEILFSAIAVGFGFATGENIFSLQSTMGSVPLLVAAMHGLATGILHISCGVVLGYGLSAVSRERYLIVPVAFGLLCLNAAYHSVYNLFTIAGGSWEYLGNALPFVVAGATLVLLRFPKTSR